MTEYGSDSNYTVSMDGPFAGGGGGSEEKLTFIMASESEWKGAASPYSQVVTVDGISLNSKVSIQMSAGQMEQLRNKDISFTVENNKGVVTVYAIGDRPNMDLTFQATITEISVISETQADTIRGNTISTGAPRTDLNQTDPSGADYLKGRETIIDMVKTASATLSAGKWVSKKQTVTVNGIMADSTKQAVLSVADPNYLTTYLDCNIRLTGSGENTLTFTCDDVPTSSVVVNVMILTKGG